MCKKVVYWCALLLCVGVTNLYAIEKESEVKDTSKLVHRLSGRNNDDNVPYRYLHKRQINPQLQSFAQPQFFQLPFDNPNFDADAGVDALINNDGSNQRPFFSSQDEEERFFLSRERTTLNPLLFPSTPTTTTTQNPIEQARVEEQRRFQEEIANRGLREQQQPRTTTATTTTTTLPNPFLQEFSNNPLVQQQDGDLFLQSQPAQFFQNSESPPSNDVNYLQHSPTAQSFARIRTFRRRRSIDRQLIAENFLSSTINPHQSFVQNFLRDANPRQDLAKIGGWLIGNLAKSFERNVAQFAETTLRPTSKPAHFLPSDYQSTPKPLAYEPSNYLSQEFQSTAKPLRSFASNQPSNHLSAEFQTTAKPLKHLMYTESPVSFYQSNLKPISTETPFNFFQSTSKPVSTETPLSFYQSTPRPMSTETPLSFFQSSSKPISTEFPFTYFQTTPKVITSEHFLPAKFMPELNYLPEQQSNSRMPPELSTNILPLEYSTSPLNLQWTTPLTTSLPNMISTHPLTSTLPPSADVWMLPQSSTSKIRNIQILPTASPQGNPSNSVYQIYNFDQNTSRPSETTTMFVQPSTENNLSITSLFKSKLNSIREADSQQLSVLEKGLPDFQQHNQFFDLLNQSNMTDNGTSLIYSTSPNAIFVRVTDEEPTSTAGYIFDKTISAKSAYKKENYVSKKNNRSPQTLKSTLVYRTPPGKRATLTRVEVAKNEQLEAGLLANILEAQGRPMSSWIVGQPKATTTGRPLVTALWNLMRKRSSLI